MDSIIVSAGSWDNLILDLIRVNLLSYDILTSSLGSEHLYIWMQDIRWERKKKKVKEIVTRVVIPKFGTQKMTKVRGSQRHVQISPFLAHAHMFQ